MKNVWRLVLVASLLAEGAGAQRPKTPAFRPVPELGYRALPDFFGFPSPPGSRPEWR